MRENIKYNELKSILAVVIIRERTVRSVLNGPSVLLLSLTLWSQDNLVNSTFLEKNNLNTMYGLSGDMPIRKASRVLFYRRVRDTVPLSIALIQTHGNETTCRVSGKALVKVS